MLCCFPLALLGGSVARADTEDGAGPAPLTLQIRLDAGAGTHQSSLPSAGATRRVAAAWFPAAGFRLALSQPPGARLRFGAELAYLSSLGYELSRAIEPETDEHSGARKQEFAALASLAIALDARPNPTALPISLGYGLSAFTTDTPLTAAQAYLLSGPRAGVGIDLPLFDDTLQLSARAELGANFSATQALRDAGAGSFGWSYAFQAEANLRLVRIVQLGLRYREAHVQLPLAATGSFHELQRFVLACLTLRNAI